MSASHFFPFTNNTSPNLNAQRQPTSRPSPTAMNSSPATSSDLCKPKCSALTDAIRVHLLGSDARVFSDVVLSTSDGHEIPACRALLAIRSLYFKNLFFLPFIERSQRKVPVNLPASSLNEIICYAYTDTCSVIDRFREAVKAEKASRQKTSHRPDSSMFVSTPRHRPAVEAALFLGYQNLAELQPPMNASPAPNESTERHSILGKRINPDPARTLPDLPIVQLIMLIRAADYVQMPTLSKEARLTAETVTTQFPETVCPAYEAICTVADDELCRPLRTHLENQIRHNVHKCLCVPDMRVKPLQKPPLTTVRVLSEATMQNVLSDSDIFTSETYLFQVLFFWATGELIYELRTVTEAKLRRWRVDARWVAAKNLVSRIDLERIKPSFLCEYVVPSTLVEQERMNETFKQQALEAERGRALYDNFRGGSRWRSGLKVLKAVGQRGTNYALESPWISNGRHEWDFKVIRTCATIWIGVASKEPSATGAPFFEQGIGWAYSSTGKLMPPPTQDFSRVSASGGPPLLEGSVVKLILNLQKSGTVTIMVEGQPKPFHAFSDLRSKAPSFIPVLVVSAPAEVELIGEKHHLL